MPDCNDKKRGIPHKGWEFFFNDRLHVEEDMVINGGICVMAAHGKDDYTLEDKIRRKVQQWKCQFTLRKLLRLLLQPCVPSNPSKQF
mmetsp:Transcript_52638/g.114851  ORF Transcript_52638/g.114851 Transcript_52638/m.114851 type:complete len:87 (+) Transcript_52638:1061-1321(+)